MNRLRRICVYCGSSPGRLPEYRAAATRLGQLLAERGIGLVYGGAGIGVMGAVADAVLEGGGQAIGVIPEVLKIKEVAHTSLTEQYVVGSMHERKALMVELADGFIAMPGGWGTLEEIFEILTWAQLGFHQKPCGLLNVAGYFDGLFAFLHHATTEEFVRPAQAAMLLQDDEPESLLDRFASYTAPQVRKWISSAET